MTQKSPLVVIPVNCRAGLSAARSRANVLSVSGSTMDSARSQALAKYYRCPSRCLPSNGVASVGPFLRRLARHRGKMD